jgi:hypothetical protein
MRSGRAWAGLFPGHEADVQEAGIDEIVAAQEVLTSAELVAHLQQSPSNFADVVDKLLQPFVLRETNVKDICVELARAGRLENTWGGGNRKPQDSHVIRLKNATG